MSTHEDQNHFIRQLETSLVRIADMQQREPGRVALMPLPQFGAARLGHDCGSEFPVGCYRVSDAFCLGAHALYGGRNLGIFREQNAHTVIGESILLNPVPCIDSTIPELESALSLVSAASYCFYHWMLDSLPKVLMAEAAGFRGSYIVPNEGVNAWVNETMGMLGIEPDRLLPMHYQFIYVADLWIPSFFYGERLHELRELQLLLRRRLLDASPAHAGGPERIYIPRRMLHRDRRILNEAEVEEILREFGFVEACMEGMSVKEQITVARGARAMAGPHGSGILHSLFMAEGSFVLEFFPRNSVKYCMTSISTALGHRHILLESPVESLDPDRLNVVVGCDALREALAQSL